MSMRSIARFFRPIRALGLSSIDGRANLIGIALFILATTNVIAADLISITSEPGTPIVSIDPQSGTIQTLFATNVASVDFQLSAFDPSLHQLYFVTGSAGSQQMVIADLQAHSVQTRSIAIPSSYGFFEWDHVTRRILAVTSGTGSPVISIDPQS